MQQNAEEKTIYLKANAGSSKNVCIRAYRQKDREAVRRICCDTGLLGKPIDAIYRDRELFADLITDPYLRYEPEQAIIAENDDEVIGYLLGSVTNHFRSTFLFCGFNTMCKMLMHLFMGKYRDHPRSAQFVRWVLLQGIKERPKHPENAAHLHFNISKNYRGGNIARYFWRIFEQQVRVTGIRDIYGEFYSYPGRRPEVIYVRYGFRIFDQCDTTMFYPEIQEPVRVICAIRSFSD